MVDSAPLLAQRRLFLQTFSLTSNGGDDDDGDEEGATQSLLCWEMPVTGRATQGYRVSWITALSKTQNSSFYSSASGKPGPGLSR
uniref:Uncharacterized protein n=1 Tax=Anguilla anguilla TaxID=7936 RepID=A0A0E9SS70_ANGAN